VAEGSHKQQDDEGGYEGDGELQARCHAHDDEGQHERFSGGADDDDDL
jgi:hypothetical protein